MRPCYVALRRVLIWVVRRIGCGALSIGFPHSQVELQISTVILPQAGLDPPGEKWQLCLNIVIALPPKPPQLDVLLTYNTTIPLQFDK